MNAVEIKKALIGIVASDGCIDTRNRLDLYSKYPEFVEHVYSMLQQVSGMSVSSKSKYDKRFDVTGYRLWTKPHVYLKKLRDVFYPSGEKMLSSYTVSRMNAVSFAYMWMCDGFLSANKNKDTNSSQNVGLLCLEAFSKDELELLQKQLTHYGISTTLKKVKWGKGYRVRIGGENLQKFISLVYPYIQPCFLYKTYLFYKGKEYVLDLPNAEQYIRYYVNVEDIVRHPQ